MNQLNRKKFDQIQVNFSNFYKGLEYYICVSVDPEPGKKKKKKDKDRSQSEPRPGSPKKKKDKKDKKEKKKKKDKGKGTNSYQLRNSFFYQLRNMPIALHTNYVT